MFKLCSKPQLKKNSEVRVVLSSDGAILNRTPLKGEDGEELKDTDDNSVYAADDPGMNWGDYGEHFDDEGLVQVKEGGSPTWWVIRRLELAEQRQLDTSALAGVSKSKSRGNDATQEWILRTEFACELGLVRVDGVELDGQPDQRLTISDENRELILAQLKPRDRREIGQRVLQWTAGLEPRGRAEGVTEGN